MLYDSTRSRKRWAQSAVRHSDMNLFICVRRIYDLCGDDNAAQVSLDQESFLSAFPINREAIKIQLLPLDKLK